MPGPLFFLGFALVTLVIIASMPLSRPRSAQLDAGVLARFLRRRSGVQQALEDAESALRQLRAENQRLAELSRKRLQLLRGLASACEAQCSPSMSDVALVQAIRDAVAAQGVPARVEAERMRTELDQLAELARKRFSLLRAACDALGVEIPGKVRDTDLLQAIRAVAMQHERTAARMRTDVELRDVALAAMASMVLNESVEPGAHHPRALVEMVDQRLAWSRPRGQA